MEPTLSYCIVNSNGRKYLLACLAAIARNHPHGVDCEILVLDNASSDGSADAARAWSDENATAVTVIALDQAEGKAANDSRLIRDAKGRYCLLLNEDSEVMDGTVAALIAALEAEPKAAAAGAQLLDGDLVPYPCAWRFPGLATACAGALFLHRRYTVQSGGGGGGETRIVDWAQSSALMVRREAAAQVDFLDPEFFVYYDECDFCKRLADAGWHTLYVPGANAIHHNQLSTDLGKGLPRIVEFHRNRDLYMRKHHGPAEAAVVRLLTAWTYGLRAIAALVVPGHSPKVHLVHARQALFPGRGRGIRDKVEAGR